MAVRSRSILTCNRQTLLRYRMRHKFAPLTAFYISYWFYWWFWRATEGRSEHQGFLGILERGAEDDAAVFAALPVELRCGKAIGGAGAEAARCRAR